MGPAELVVFLQALPSPLPASVCAELDRAFQLRTTRNLEIRVNWILVQLRSGIPEGTAAALGLTVHTVRTADELLRQAEALRPACVLVDLHNPGLAITDVVTALKGMGAVRVIAYGSHVEAATLRAAREAGCDRVLPRSQFVEELPREIAAWLSPLAG